MEVDSAGGMAKAMELEGEDAAAPEGAEGAAEEDPMCPKSWPPREWHVGMRVDAKDKHGGWYEAKILKVEEERVRVHFRGWGREDGKSRFDEWANKDDLDKIAAFQTLSAAKAEPEESDDDDEPDDDSYAVNQIIRSRTTDGGESEFRVSWLGRDKSENEWVAESRLRDPEDLDVAEKLDKFVAAAAKREAKKAQAEKSAASAASASTDVDYAGLMSKDQHEQFTTLLSLTGTDTAQGKADAYQALQDTFWDVTTAFDKLSRRRSANTPQRLDVTVNGDHQPDEDPESDDELTEDESELEEDEETDDSDSDSDDDDEQEEEGDESADEDDEDEDDEVEDEDEFVEEPVPDGWQPETWTVGYMCDALDGFNDWFQAKVLEVEDNQRVKIHFQGWPSRWDEWMPVTSDRLAPHKFRSNKDAKAARKKFKAEQEAKKQAKAEAKAAEKAKEAKKLKAKIARDKKRAKSKKTTAAAKAKLKAKQDKASIRDAKKLARELKKRERERLREEKRQAKKDKGPKRPISAYFYFMQEDVDEAVVRSPGGR
eukprot:COSAG02_NODE_5881_length_3965_cov_51.574496_1_plen_542_part_00